jgi:glycerate kinase
MVACDVTNPLLGRTGAATIYGPQKGANGGDIVALEAGLTRWADEVERVTGRYERNRAGAGAAGGVGFGARAMLGATMSSGIELLLELLGFHARLRHADLVVTGEGSLDAQTLHGKGPAGVAAAAARAGVPTVAVAGQISLGPEALAGVGLARAYALSDLEPDLGRCVSEARHLLVTIGRRLVSDWPRLRDERLEPVRLGRAGVRSSERTRIPLRLE